MKRFTRLSLGFFKKLENLEAACAVFLAYYNFCWRTRDVNEGRTRLPAAMGPRAWSIRSGVSWISSTA